MKKNIFFNRYMIFCVMLLCSIKVLSQTYLKTYLTYTPTSTSSSCTKTTVTNLPTQGCTSTTLTFNYGQNSSSKSGPASASLFPSGFTQTLDVSGPVLTDAATHSGNLRFYMDTATPFTQTLPIAYNPSFPPASGTNLTVTSYPFYSIRTDHQTANGNGTLTLLKNGNVGTTGLTSSNVLPIFSDLSITGTTTTPAYTAPTSFSGGTPPTTITPSTSRFVTTYYYNVTPSNNISTVLTSYPNIIMDTSYNSFRVAGAGQNSNINSGIIRQVGSAIGIDNTNYTTGGFNQSFPVSQPTVKLKTGFLATTANPGGNVYNIGAPSWLITPWYITLSRCPDGQFNVSNTCLSTTGKTISFNVDSDANGSYETTVLGGTWTSSNSNITLNTSNALTTGIISISASSAGTSIITYTSVDGCSYTYTLTITADNTVTTGGVRTLCVNTPLSPVITHTTTGATGIGTASGLPTGITATFAANTITLSGTPTVTGTFNYSIPLIGGCGNINATGTIIVNLSAAIPTILTTSATCSSSGTATITNYNSSYTYIFSPLGPVVGNSGAITNISYGSSYTVTVDNGVCISSPSSAFIVAAQLTGSSCVSTYCYKAPIISGLGSDTKVGITALNRAGTYNGNWPMTRKGGWIALESKEKGFVINRIPTTAGLLGITNPIEGMVVYDEEAECMKIFTIKDGDTTAAWHCISNQTCPD